MSTNRDDMLYWKKLEEDALASPPPASWTAEEIAEQGLDDEEGWEIMSLVMERDAQRNEELEREIDDGD